MFGNTLGWGISAVIIAGIIGFLAFLEKANAVSPPGALTNNPLNLAALAFPVSPESVVPMNEPGDAGPLYKQAIADYTSQHSEYDNLRSLDVAKGLKGLDLLLQATHMQTATLFAQQADRVISYDNDKPLLPELRALGEAALRAGSLAKIDKDYDLAFRYFESAFALGAHLAKERIVYTEFQAGLQLLSGGAQAILTCAEDAGTPDKGKAADAFYKTGYTEYDKAYITPIWTAIATPDDNLITRHTGDMFKLATDSQERMWRVEATLKLGRMKFDVGDRGRAGDQRGAKAMLKRLADDPDAHVQMAARKGLELDLLGFRTLR